MNKRIYSILTCIALSLGLTSCAAGAATAAYSLKAQTADGLSAEAEQRIIQRAKNEVFSELNSSKSSISQCQ